MLFSLVWNQTAITDTHFHLTCFLDAMKNKGITMHAGKSADMVMMKLISLQDLQLSVYLWIFSGKY